MSTIDRTRQLAPNSTAATGTRTLGLRFPKNAIALSTHFLQASIGSIKNQNPQADDPRKTLTELLSNTVPPGWVDQLPIELVKDILKLRQNRNFIVNQLVKHPVIITQLLVAGVQLPEIGHITSTQLKTLRAANNAVVKALINVGMHLDDIASIAATVTAGEVADTGFMTTLKSKLAAGRSAPDAILLARYSGSITAQELADPGFCSDLINAAGKGHGNSKTEAIHYARAERVVRHTEGGVDLTDALKLTDNQLNLLMAVDVMTRYKSFATEKEMADPAFRKHLIQAASQGMTPVVAVHFARANMLVDLLKGAVTLPAAMALSNDNLKALLAGDTTTMRGFLAAGLTLTQYLHTPAEHRHALLSADPKVVKALLQGGMLIADVAVLASRVSAAEITRPGFTLKLAEKLFAGLSARDALLWARFSGIATDAELSDPQFLKDLSSVGPEVARAPLDILNYVRIQHLAGRLGIIDPKVAVQLTPEVVNGLMNIDTDQINCLLDRGLTLQQISQTSNNERGALLGTNQNGDPSVFAKLVRNLVSTGMNVHLIAAYAGTVISPEEATAELLQKIAVCVANGGSVSAVIAVSRYGNTLSPAELASPQFLQNLLYVPPSTGGPDQRFPALSMIGGLSYARFNVDIFEAAEAVSTPGSDPHNQWFSNNGVTQLSGMSTDSAEWSQIESTLGRSLSTGERQAAITAAKGLSDNWSYLCENAGALNLNLRQGTTDVIDFTKDNLSAVNMSPIINLLGNAPVTVDGQSLNVISALGYTRDHINIFEAAESLADSSSNPKNGWFSNSGVSKLANMTVDDPGWSKIEALVGGVMSTDDRQLAISAAKGLNDNWSLLCSRAGNVGLSLREGTTDTIDFSSDNMRQLNFGGLIDSIGTTNTIQALNRLKYARAEQVEQNLMASGVPIAAGGSLMDILMCSTAQIQNLMAMDPAAIRTLLAHALPLSEIADLSSAQVSALALINPTLVTWLQSLGNYSLSDISQLTNAQIVALQTAKSGGFRQATAGENFDNIRPETISRPISLGGGVLTFETTAGDKIIVDKNSNFDLYKKVSGLQQTSLKTETDAVRTQYGLPATADVDVMGMATTTLNKAGDPNSGYMTVGTLTVKTLVDQYRSMLANGEMSSDDPRAKLVRAFDARGVLSNGYNLMPYTEEVSGSGTGTNRVYPGGEKNPTFMTTSLLDTAALLDPAKVDAQIAALMANPTVQKDYQVAIDASTSTWPAGKKQALIDQLSNAMASPAYTEAVQALKDKGQSYAAEKMIADDTADLALLDPAKATETAQTLTRNSLQADLLRLQANPGLVDNVSFDQAATDAISITIQALRSGSAAIRHGTQSTTDLVKYLNEFSGDKKSVTALASVLKELVIEAKKSSGTINLADVSKTDFDAAMNKTYMPQELRGKVAGFFANTQKAGVWGSISGAAAIAAFGYKLSKGAWGPNSTALERFGAARDIISFLSVGNHVHKLGATVVDGFINMIGKTPGGEAAWTAMGLDRTLPEVWGKKSFLPDGKSWGELWKSYDATAAAAVRGAPPVVGAAADNMAHLWEAARPNNILPGGMALRVGMSAIKILGTVTDLGGVADIVIGALGLQKSIASGNAAGIASNTVGIASGAALTMSGIIGTAGLFAAVPAIVAAAVAPLFFVGAILGGIGFIIASATANAKRHDELQTASTNQTQWFSALAADGLTTSDWQDKLEYLRYAFTTYGDDNTNANNQSYFQFQKAEWNYFQNTPSENGSSTNRLNKDLHFYTDESKPAPVENSYPL